MDISRGRTKQQAFGELYDLHYPVIFNYVMRTVMNVAAAEDITSETFFRALRSFESQKKPDSFGPWIYRIATNTMMDHFRSRRYDRAADSASVDLHGLCSTGSEIDSSLEDTERFQKVHQAIRTLKPGLQLVVMLFYFEKKSHREIAAIMNCQVVTIKWRLHRARQLLAKQLAAFRKEIAHEGRKARSRAVS